MLLLLLPHLYLCAEICDRLSLLGLPVRLHSRILEKGFSWARLWYALRAIDTTGSGYVTIELEFLTWLLGAGSSTIYQWLREGKKAGAFRWYKYQRGTLRVALGGLFAISRAQGWEVIEENPDWKRGDRQKYKKKGINAWGVTVEVTLKEVLTLAELRAYATAAVTQRSQQLARYAAWRNLPKQVRHFTDASGKRGSLHLPQPSQFFDPSENRPCHDSGKRGIPFLLAIGKRWISVSKGFVPYGASLPKVARERGYQCNRTVQRHLKLVGMEAKQIIQSKAAYRAIKEAIRWDSPSIAPEPDISVSWSRTGYTMVEPAGRHGNPYQFKLNADRLFVHKDRPYIYRCNLYNPTLKLCRMSAARRGYTTKIKETMDPQRKNAITADVLSSRAGGCSTEITKVGFNFLDLPEIERQNP